MSDSYRKEVLRIAEQCLSTLPRTAEELQDIATVLREYHSRQRGLKQSTAEALAQSAGSLKDLVKGVNPQGKCAEVVALYEYELLRMSGASSMVNAPPLPNSAVHSHRLMQDPQSIRDLSHVILRSDGSFKVVPGPQVKTGSPTYIARSLRKMANTPKAGRVGVVDAVFVLRDGSPRVAPGAFTEAQAKSLRDSGVTLRGIPGLTAKARQLLWDINKKLSAQSTKKSCFSWATPKQVVVGAVLVSLLWVFVELRRRKKKR